MNWQVKTRVWGRTVPKPGWCIPCGHINRIYYIHSGTAYIDADHKRMQLRPGYLYLLPEGIRFTAWMDDGDPVDHTYFDFDLLPCLYFQQILEIHVSEYSLIQKWLDLAEGFFQTYFCKRYDTAVLDVINASLQNLLFILSGITEFPAINDVRILDTLIYIQDHLEKPLSVETLSARFFLDKHYFIRLFSQCTGQSPHRYIQNKRMNRAVFLLQKGLSAKQTAEACGFGSYSAFARAFYTCYGCSPNRYLEGEIAAKSLEML